MEEQNQSKPVSLEELSSSMEKMYNEHNAQMATMSRMISSMARLAKIDPALFAEEIRNDTGNLEFASAFNKRLDDLAQEENKAE
jgi:hypothetical protein